MPVKMIVTDLDRTLLRTDKTISDYTADVFNRCHQNGIKVAFATARPKRTVTHFCEKIPADAVILHNGAVICVNDIVIKKCGISSDIKNQVLLSISRDFPKATISVEIDDMLYVNFDISAVWNNTRSINTDFTDLPDKPADKIIIGVTSINDIERLTEYLPNDLYIEISEGKFGLIMNRGATKWRAIHDISRYFNIRADEIAVFGDDCNDIDMLKNCGIGVAVANAINEAKAVADYVCDTNDSDGVARWIEENVL